MLVVNGVSGENKPALHLQLVALIMVKKKNSHNQKKERKNLYFKGTYILEQTCVPKTFHGADHLGNDKQFVTAAVHRTVVQKSPCAALCSIRKENGFRASHNSKRGLPLWSGAVEAPH